MHYIIFQLTNDIIMNYEIRIHCQDIFTIYIPSYGNGLIALQCGIFKVLFDATLAIILLQKMLLLQEPQD